MPITKQGWELHIVREIEQRRPSDGRRRTVGRYQVYHDGVAQTGTDLSGMTAEAKGPGANVPADNGKRIEAKRYPLWAQEPGRYATNNYSNSEDPEAEPTPAFELKNTGDRYEILVHPGHDFLASVGCINLCKSLPDAWEPISYVPSRKRVISVIEDMKKYLGIQFPTSTERKYPRPGSSSMKSYEQSRGQAKFLILLQTVGATMSKSNSYLDKTFVVTDPDARIRKPGELMIFQVYTAADVLPPGARIGSFKRIPQNTEVKVDDIEIQLTGSSGSIVFAHAISTDGGQEYGWTSVRNFHGKFINETRSTAARNVPSSRVSVVASQHCNRIPETPPSY